RYHPFRDEQGRVVRWYATGTDIEDRKRAEERTRNENVALREKMDRPSMFEEIVGSSAALRQVLAQVAKVAPTDSTVLISGETGTGKELIARAVHKRSNRSARAFIRVNCGAISPSLRCRSPCFVCCRSESLNASGAANRSQSPYACLSQRTAT